VIAQVFQRKVVHPLVPVLNQLALRPGIPGSGLLNQQLFFGEFIHSFILCVMEPSDFCS